MSRKYSPEAQAGGVKGAVVVATVVVDETGAVADAKILNSIPLLDEAALAAVRNWRYEPTLRDELHGPPPAADRAWHEAVNLTRA